MALRSEYSLGHSEYNAFLFAAVGEEKIGMPLTVLTALTRLGIDPWQEAARLADLSKEAALRTFAATIAKLPEGDWKAADSEAIAARLLSWLPGKSTKAVPRSRGQTQPCRQDEAGLRALAGVGRARARRPPGDGISAGRSQSRTGAARRHDDPAIAHTRASRASTPSGSAAMSEASTMSRRLELRSMSKSPYAAVLG